MGAVLFGIGILIIFYNLIINSTNIFKIVRFCFQTNTLGQYWDLIFKSCVSARAIFSSIIGIVIALAIFIIITPVILIKGSIQGKKVAALLDEGLLFEYPDLSLEGRKLQFKSNINSVLNLDVSKIPVSGKIRMDAILAISEINEQAKLENKELIYDVMHKIKLKDSREAIAPLYLTIEHKIYPTYFIYNKSQKEQYKKVKNTLFDSGFKNCLYFSVVDMHY